MATRSAPRQPEGVHGRDAGREGQVVPGDDRGRVAIVGEPGLQPREPLVAERAVVAADLRGVAADQAQRTAARHVAVVLARALGDGERQREAPAQAAARSSWLPASTACTGMVSAEQQPADALVLARASRAR